MVISILESLARREIKQPFFEMPVKIKTVLSLFAHRMVDKPYQLFQVHDVLLKELLSFREPSRVDGLPNLQ